MNALYVTGCCLTKNTSASMSHNSYVQGLVEHGIDVDIIMANSSWGEEDVALPRWDKATYFTYESRSASDRLKSYLKRTVKRGESAAKPTGSLANASSNTVISKNRLSFYQLGKKAFYLLFPSDPVYPLDRQWLKNAQAFKSAQVYDLVISNSSPAAGHRLVANLIKAKHLHCKRWIQIWEDPWFHDLYGGHDERIREEEHALLREATEVYYVSPLTLEYQKQYYADCAAKMKFVPLPYLEYDSAVTAPHTGAVKFGYFGDYYSKTRNLTPFYDALIQTQNYGMIVGDADIQLSSTNKIQVQGRVTLDKLSEIQKEADVLVHLCNLRGGQIPGKIYHYSATTKPILFILDGTKQEVETLYKIFEPYHRFVFCQNTVQDISRAINTLSVRDLLPVEQPVKAFSPYSVIQRIMEDSQ